MGSSSPTRGDYGHDGMEDRMDKKNKGVHWSEDVNFERGENWPRNNDGVKCFECNLMSSSCPSNWTMVLQIPPML
jgi:NAD-dependent dihydropyrimidine dehydrogenase PreA subunit